MHANGVISPDYLNYETVIGGKFYHVLDTYIQSESQKLLPNAGFQLRELFVKLHAPSVLIFMKAFRSHALRLVMQQAVHQVYSTPPHWAFPMQIQER